MNVVWTNLVLWPLVGLTAAPVLVHLFARSRPPKYPFSSVRFLRQVVRKTNRVRKPRDWILMLVRTALFTLLTAMFLMPLLLLSAKYNPFKARNVVIVLDASASMNWLAGAQTRFSAACGEADSILEKLGPGDTANIVWLDKFPDSVFPEMGSNTAYLRNMLRNSEATSENGDAATALRLALKLLEWADGRKEICVISDFQKTQWDKVSVHIPEEVSLAFIEAGPGKAPNCAVGEIHYSPRAPLQGECVDISARIYNFSQRPRKRRVSMRTQGARQSREIMIPANADVTAVFRQRMTAQGKVPVEISLDEDRFAMDNTRGLILNVKQQLSVGVVGTSIWGNSRVWRKALDALSWAKPFTVPEEDALKAQADILMLDGWNGDSTAELAAAVSTGTSLFIAPSPNIRSDHIMRLFDLSPEPESAGTLNPTDLSAHVSINEPGHPAFALFADGQYGDPASAGFSSRLPVSLPETEHVKILMQYEDGFTALAYRREKGALCLWNMPLKDKYSDWASTAVFLPFFGELLLASRPLPDTPETSAEPGECLTRIAPHSMRLEAIRLMSEDETSVKFIPEPCRGTFRLTSVPLKNVGLYVWKEKERTADKIYSNLNIAESNMKAISPDRLVKERGGAFLSANSVNRLSNGVSLWPWLLGIALATTAAEGLLMNVFRDS